MHFGAFSAENLTSHDCETVFMGVGLRRMAFDELANHSSSGIGHAAYRYGRPIYQTRSGGVVSSRMKKCRYGIPFHTVPLPALVRLRRRGSSSADIRRQCRVQFQGDRDNTNASNNYRPYETTGVGQYDWQVYDNLYSLE